jgi:hypothetical protein
MPQFDIYVRNPTQWGIRALRAENPDAALADAQRLIEDDPGGFEMFYDGEFCDTVTLIRVCERGASVTLATWRRGDHGLRLLGTDLLAAAETVVERCREANLADSMRRLAVVIAKTRQSDG